MSAHGKIPTDLFHSALDALEGRRLERALVCFNALLRISPNYLPGRLGRARALEALGRFEEAAIERSVLAEVLTVRGDRERLSDLNDLRVGFRRGTDSTPISRDDDKPMARSVP